MSSQHLVYWEKQDRIGSIVLNSPPSNQMDRHFLNYLFDAIEKASHEVNHLGAIVIRSSGRHFSSGADLNDIKKFVFEDIGGAGGETHFGNNVFRTSKAFELLNNLPVPVIAAISGVCIGSGFELALAAHLRIAADNSVLGLPETTWNLMPGCAGTLRLTRIASTGLAHKYILTGETFTAADGWTMGAIDLITGKNELQTAVFDLARKIIDHGNTWIHSVMKEFNSLN